MKIGQKIFYTNTCVRSEETEYNLQYIQTGKFLAQDAHMTAIVDERGVVYFVHNDEVTEDDELGARMNIVDALLTRDDE